jgi:flavin reductase (DIM6/NTAB) family NADH-FMN oxidoreductase RutF
MSWPHPLTGLNEREHIRLINSLSGFRNAFLVGTADKQGKSNLAIFSSIFHVGANPPLLGMLSRPDSVDRHTLQNIRATGSWTLNGITREMVPAAHQTSARYDRDTSEFDATGLEEAHLPGVHAPHVKNSPLVMALNLRQEIRLELNGTVLLIGEITHLHFNQQALAADGWLDIEKLGLVAVSGLDAYHVTQRIGRLSYAKAKQTPDWIEGGPQRS